MDTAKNAFEFVSAALERCADLDRLEARGTVRIALKSAGFEPETVTGMQIAIVLEKVMPQELEKRGVESAVEICRKIASEVKDAPWSGSTGDSPDVVFARLGRTD